MTYAGLPTRPSPYSKRNPYADPQPQDQKYKLKSVSVRFQPDEYDVFQRIAAEFHRSRLIRNPTIPMLMKLALNKLCNEYGSVLMQSSQFQAYKGAAPPDPRKSTFERESKVSRHDGLGAA